MKPQVYSCSRSPPPQFWDDSLSIQVLHRCSWLWRFNPLLLRLLGEVSISLLCLHSSRGSALVLAPPLRVGCPQPSVPTRQDGVKASSSWLGGSGSLLPGGERGSVVIIGMRGEPALAEAGVTLHQPETHPVFSQGSCPWIAGPWQWRSALAPGRGGVESDLCLHTGFLVAAAADLASHAHLWGPCW